MKIEWQRQPLSTIAEIIMGQSPPGTSCNDLSKGLPLLNGPTEFGSHHPIPEQWTTEAKKIARPNDILFCVRGSTTGRMNWADQEYAIGRGIAAMRHKSGNDYQAFLRCLIEANLPDLLASATGSTFPNVSGQQLNAMLCFIPPPEIQCAISELIGRIDKKIELNRQINRTLEAMAQAIFKSWFVDFDPVTAKAAGRKPFGMDDATVEFFPNAFTNGDSNGFPAGWSSVPIYEFAEVVYGAPFASSRFNSDGIGLPLIRIRDLWTQNPEIYTDEQPPKGKVINPGDILVSMDGDFRAYLWQGPAAWLNQRVCQFAPKDGVGTAFIFFSIQDPLGISERANVGTTVNHLGKTDIDRFVAVQPGKKIISRFQEITEPLMKKIIQNSQESTTLTTIRDLLLPKLLSGEVRVKQAEKIVEKVS